MVEFRNKLIKALLYGDRVCRSRVVFFFANSFVAHGYIGMIQVSFFFFGV